MVAKNCVSFYSIQPSNLIDSTLPTKCRQGDFYGKGGRFESHINILQDKYLQYLQCLQSNNKHILCIFEYISLVEKECWCPIPNMSADCGRSKNNKMEHNAKT